MELLEIRNLRVEFATAQGAFRAVDAVDLTVDAGQVLAIVGESGSGKSVAMLALMGLLPWTAKVTSDVMSFGGNDLRSVSAIQRRKIVGKDMAMIFQEPMSSLNPCFTAGFQVKEALRQHLGLDARARHARAIELFEMVGIPAPEQRLRAFPHQLSGGMNQRVMIAMAIACGPKLLIADEPTTALDVTIQAQILDLLTALQRDTGMALILITHDMGVVAETAERVSVQYAGQKVEEQPVAGLFASPHHPYSAALLAALPERATGRHLPTIPGAASSPMIAAGPRHPDRPLPHWGWRGATIRLSPSQRWHNDRPRRFGTEPQPVLPGKGRRVFPARNVARPVRRKLQP
jgi:dipeptide transport system ATP-binding protein